MSCLVCGSEAYSPLLRKQKVKLWTDFPDSDEFNCKHVCELNQCLHCGHVYLPVSADLRQRLADVYRSASAQGVSPMGVGAWGEARAERLFFNKINLKNYTSALEIGCGDGFLLKCLKDKGFSRLLGVEPSDTAQSAYPGIEVVNDFLNESLCLEEKFDLIYSVAVIEHIDDVNQVISFCRSNLTPDGTVFFVVPNAQLQLEMGDPGLFIHQHVHYFTENTLRFLMEKNGFGNVLIASTNEDITVTANVASVDCKSAPVCVSYIDYEPKLDLVLARLSQTLSNEKALIHGACNSVNNVAGWIKGSFDLADNDKNKVGKTYFGRVVQLPEALDLTSYSVIFVASFAYFEIIKKQYIDMGFAGRVVPFGW